MVVRKNIPRKMHIYLDFISYYIFFIFLFLSYHITYKLLFVLSFLSLYQSAVIIPFYIHAFLKILFKSY